MVTGGQHGQVVGRANGSLGSCAVVRTLLLAATIVLQACESPTDPSNPGPNPPDPTTVPVLSVPIVDLTRVRRFVPFGAQVSTGALHPAYELVTNTNGAGVQAATAGTVILIRANQEGDFEVQARPADASYLVIYNHLLDVVVTVGQNLEPGTPIGRVGVWTPSQGRADLQIRRNNVALCPRTFGTAEFNAAHDTVLAAADPNLQQPEWTSVCLAQSVAP